MATLMILAAWAPPTWGQLVTRGQAARLGLVRSWFAQVDLDSARHRIAHWLLHDHLLLVVTTAGTIHALDATTGKTVWSTQVGQAKYPTLGPAANSNNVAVINGSKLILLDRDSGRVKWIRETGDAPSSGPALSDTRVFVALLNGRVEAYPLDNNRQTPWFYQSAGHVYQHPMTTAKSISWATDLGTLYVGRLKPLSILFRLKTAGEIVAPPAGMDPYLLVGSTRGNIICIHEQSGAERWRIATGFPITDSPAVVHDQIYVASQEPRLHVLDATTGLSRWSTAGVTQFVARGRQHVYATDRQGRLLALDPKTGGMVGRLPYGRKQAWNEQSSWSPWGPWSKHGHALINDQNDRIYLFSDTGLVQCLHERGISAPISYRQPANSSDKESAATATKTKDHTKGSLAADKASSVKPDGPRDNAATPATADAKTPAEALPASEDPFGDTSNPFAE